MSTRDQLMAEIEAFRARNGMNETRFGELALHDVALIHKMKRGRSVTIDTADRIRAFMRDYIPQDGKPRPKLEGAAA